MKLLFKILFLYCLMPVALTFGIEPLQFTVSELINGKQLYNNLTVRFQGEVIGQRLSKTTHVWINILDSEGNAIGAYMPRTLSNQIQHYGTYQTTGDKVLIEGIYHSKCDEHGGDTDIHVEKLVILERGTPRNTDKIKTPLVVGCFTLFSITMLLVYLKKKFRLSSS